MRVRILWMSVIFCCGYGILNAYGATPQTVQIPPLHVGINTSQEGDLAVPLQILLLLTLLTFIPAIIMAMTSFARIVIVLSFVRQALGTQQMPPNQILIGLALFLTLFVMAPIGEQIRAQALQPYLARQITIQEALEKALVPLRQFMLSQTREKDLLLFMQVAKQPQPKNADDVPTTALIPAFMISELKTAFQIGFLLYIPFLILDLVVSSILLSMGMMMLPPVLISLPFKVILFVLVDGWNLLIGSLVRSFQ